MDIDEIIERVFSEKFYSLNKDKFEEIANFLRGLNDEFVLSEGNIELGMITKKLKDDSFDIDLSVTYNDNNLSTLYNFGSLNEIIINNLPTSVKKITAPISFFRKNLERLKEFESLEEITIDSYVFFKPEELAFLKENTNVKRINFNSHIFNEEDYSGCLFINNSNVSKILYGDMVLENEALKSNLDGTLKIVASKMFDVNDLDKAFSYALNDTKRINMISSTGKYVIDINDKDVMINVTDPNIDICAYLFNYFKRKGYNVTDVSFSLEDGYKSPVVKDYTSLDYSLLDLLSKQTNLTVKYDIISSCSYDDFKGLAMSMKWYRSLINDYDLSPLEKLTFAYDIMKTFEYKETSNEDTFESRTPYKIIKTGNIVCVGYTNMLEEIIKDTDGISFTDFSVSCFKDDDVTFLDYHSRGMVRVDDDKYGVHGIYIIDPTWDSYKKNGKEKLGSDYTALDLYSHYLICPSDYKVAFPHDSLPMFFKKDFNTLNSDIDNLDGHSELKEKTFVDKDLFTLNFDEIFDKSMSNEDKLDYLRSSRISKSKLMDIIRSVRLAEGFKESDLDEEMERVSNMYDKLSKLDIDPLTGKVK